MLYRLLEKEVTWITVPESLLYAVLGFAVTFLGICILIFFVWAMGKIVGAVNARKQGAVKPAPVEQPAAESQGGDGIPDEVKVAIVAAIAAYYEGESSACEFKVKRIKRL